MSAALTSSQQRLIEVAQRAEVNTLTRDDVNWLIELAKIAIVAEVSIQSATEFTPQHIPEKIAGQTSADRERQLSSKNTAK